MLHELTVKGHQLCVNLVVFVVEKQTTARWKKFGILVLWTK